jgi:hypothetical protein
MIDPRRSDDRQQLSRAADHAFVTLRRFATLRDSTVRAYLGASPHSPSMDWTGLSDRLSNKKYMRSLPKGNLLQMAGLSMQIALAYGEPEYLCTHRVAEQAGLADKLYFALNRMVKLLDMGQSARDIAADSFFGYGIFKVGVGCLPLAAQQATGIKYGPCVWRVSQNDYIYDISASARSNCAFEGDVYHLALNEAQELYPEHADLLVSMTNIDRMQDRHVLPRPSNSHAPEPEVKLIDMYFPAARVVATWPIMTDTFGTLADEPLVVREHNGHWSGPYEVLTHLYSPDELVPLAQAESVKALHFLFNDLMEITSNQARKARYNPIYQAGAEKDMKRIWESDDRAPVSVIDPSRFGSFQIPGPDQSQTAYMAAIMQLFKQFVPTSDEPHRAPTATQGALMRQTTNAVVAEARRKFNRSLQLVGYKLGHLLMHDENIVLPAEKPLRPGSPIMIDMTWLPAGKEPRNARIDDFEINIEPFSTLYRSPEEKLGTMGAITQQILGFMQAKAMGMPINLENIIETYSKYAGLPEIKGWFDEVFPMQAAQAQSSRMSNPRVGVGEYVRTNVSEKTDEGALEQNLTQSVEGDSGIRMGE